MKEKRSLKERTEILLWKEEVGLGVGDDEENGMLSFESL